MNSGKNAVGLYVASMVVGNNFFNDPNVIMRAVKIGGVFYLVKISVETIENGGEMPRVSISRIVDDVSYYSASYGFADTVGLTRFLNNSIPDIIPSTALDNALKSGIIWEIIQEMGNQLSNSQFDWIRHISGKLGIH
jgi:hypothetical protein